METNVKLHDYAVGWSGSIGKSLSTIRRRRSVSGVAPKEIGRQLAYQCARRQLVQEPVELFPRKLGDGISGCGCFLATSTGRLARGSARVSGQTPPPFPEVGKPRRRRDEVLWSSFFPGISRFLYCKQHTTAPAELSRRAWVGRLLAWLQGIEQEKTELLRRRSRPRGRVNWGLG